MPDPVRSNDVSERMSDTPPQYNEGQQGQYYVDPNGPRYQNPEEFNQSFQMPPPIETPFDPSMMKQIALQRAIEQQREWNNQNISFPDPNLVAPQEISNEIFKDYIPEERIVYVKRNFTVAEILIVLMVATGIVTGFQFIWNFTVDVLPRIEIKAK